MHLRLFDCASEDFSSGSVSGKLSGTLQSSFSVDDYPNRQKEKVSVSITGIDRSSGRTGINAFASRNPLKLCYRLTELLVPHFCETGRGGNVPTSGKLN
jgi:hypothetical protein